MKILFYIMLVFLIGYGSGSFHCKTKHKTKIVYKPIETKCVDKIIYMKNTKDLEENIIEIERIMKRYRQCEDRLKECEIINQEVYQEQAAEGKLEEEESQQPSRHYRHLDEDLEDYQEFLDQD